MEIPAPATSFWWKIPCVIGPGRSGASAQAVAKWTLRPNSEVGYPSQPGSNPQAAYFSYPPQDALSQLHPYSISCRDNDTTNLTVSAR